MHASELGAIRAQSYCGLYRMSGKAISLSAVLNMADNDSADGHYDEGTPEDYITAFTVGVVKHLADSGWVAAPVEMVEATVFEYPLLVGVSRPHPAV